MWQRSTNNLTICLCLAGIVLNAPVLAYGATLNEPIMSEEREMETDLLDNFNKRGSWQSLHGTWGKRGFGWSQISEDGSDNENMPALLYTDEDSAVIQPIFDNDENNDILTEKRKWKNMNVRWNKRRNTPAWNKFRGAWGKREPGWNNLKGMWGKRDAKQWQKLHTGWGKRSQQSPMPFTDTN